MRSALVLVQIQRVVPQHRLFLDLPRADGVFHQHIAALVVNVILLVRINVLHVALVVHKVRDGPDEVFAGVKHLQHGPPLGVKGQPVVHLHLSGKAGVVSRVPYQVVRVLFLHPGNALALALVEDGRVRHALDHPVFQHRVVLFRFPYAPGLLHRVDLQAFVRRTVAAVQLLDAVQPALFVRCVPPHREGPRVAKIVPAPDLPVHRNAKRLDDVGPPLVLVVGRVVPPFGEHLAAEAVPAAIEQRLLLRLR